MTSATGYCRGKRSNRSRTGGFTLIELIIVMTMMTVVIALIAPSLSRFFRGRTQDAEARRLLALTQYGQSRAVSEGIPMSLWIDTKNNAYGLQQETGYSDSDGKAVDYAVDKDLHIEIVSGKKAVVNTVGLPAIHFLPDSTVTATSVKAIGIQEGNQWVWIKESANGLSYEISSQSN